MKLLYVLMVFFCLVGTGMARASNSCEQALRSNRFYDFISQPENFLHELRSDLFRVSENHIMIIEDSKNDFIELAALPDSEAKARVVRRLEEIFMQSLSVSEFINLWTDFTWSYEFRYILFKADLYTMFHFLNPLEPLESYDNVEIKMEDRNILLTHPDLFKDFNIDIASLRFKRTYAMVNGFLGKNTSHFVLTPFLKMYLMATVHQKWNKLNGIQFKSLEEKISSYLSLAPVKTLEILYAFAMNVVSYRPELLDRNIEVELQALMQISGSRTNKVNSPKTKALFSRVLSQIISTSMGPAFGNINNPLPSLDSKTALTQYETHTLQIMERLVSQRAFAGESLNRLFVYASNSRQWAQVHELLRFVEPWLTISNTELFEFLNKSTDKLGEAYSGQTHLMNSLIEKTEGQKKKLLEDFYRRQAQRDQAAQREKIKEEEELNGVAFYLSLRPKSEEGFKNSLPNEKTLQRREQKRLRKKMSLDASMVTGVLENSGLKGIEKKSGAMVSYNDELTNSYYKSFSNLPLEVRQFVTEENLLGGILKDPYASGDLKRHNFPRNLRVYKFSFNRVKYRLAYEIHGQKIVFFYIGKRDDFYDVIQRRYRSGTSMSRRFEESDEDSNAGREMNLMTQ